jgi:hypothetical protein
MGLAAVLAVRPVPAGAQSGVQSLGSVTIGRKVMADGQPLAAGTYALRVSAEAVTAVVGQAAEGYKWIEFVQGGQVKGRELATVVPGAEVKQIAKGAPPAAGRTKVELLKGSEYLRVWVNRAGTHYLIHLTVG